MIKFNNIKVGDYLMGEYEGKMWRGEVVRLNGDEKQVCLQTDVQAFWFETDHLHPIPINDAELTAMHFEKEVFDDGAVKYKKEAFRIVIAKADDFSNMDIWYREDRRHNPDIHYIHELQNHYHDMTKVHLTAEPVH
ncbi:MAG: hypothetical protein K2Y12_05350 [Chitinophagaceae bacterium]|nr:hypothetical protein [Chitinophagaceae bacterium]HAK11247.1 hypothetical protein [Chitinophagaceae bacterium]HCT22163.1 hypothetical protein [Chitinophagaceae bacterium]